MLIANQVKYMTEMSFDISFPVKGAMLREERLYKIWLLQRNYGCISHFYGCIL